MGLFNLFGGDTQQDQQSTSNDNSQSSSSQGGDVAGGGLNLQLGNASGATLNLSDPGALNLAREIALGSLSTAQSSVSSMAASTEKALTESLGLADKSRQTDTQAVFGNLAKALPWMVLAGAAAFMIFKPNFFKKKKAAA